MKITMYELLGKVKDEPDRSIYVKYFDRVNKKECEMWACKENIIYKLDQLIIELNDEVEILEEEKKIPEKLPYYSMEKIQKAKNKDEWREERITLLEKRVNDLHIKINSIIDYLKSKGE